MTSQTESSWVRRHWLKTAALLVLIGIGLGVWYVVIIFNRVTGTLEDQYAAMNVGGMIVNYVEAHNAWPTSWSDLETMFEESYNRPDTHGEMDRYRELVEVDWTVDVYALTHSESHHHTPYPVVRCYSGAPPGPTDLHDANLIIFEYLQSRGPHRLDDD